MKPNSEKVVTRTLEVDGKPMAYIGTQSGIEFYEDHNSDENIMYGVKGSAVVFTILAESVSHTGHSVEFTMYTVDNEDERDE